MARYLAAVVVTLTALAACAPSVSRFAPMTIVSGVDFARYSQKGFLFSPDPYTLGPYDAVGLVSVVHYAGARYIPDSSHAGPGYWQFQPVEAQEVFDTLYARAAAMGANAVVRMEIRSVERAAEAPRPATPGVEVRGYAIRRRPT